MNAAAVVLSAAGGLSGGLIVTQAVGDVPWDKLAGGSAALLVAGILFFVLKHVEKVSDKSYATIIKVADEFSKCQRDTIEKSAAAQRETAEKLAETATIVMREHRESNERQNQALHQLIRDLHQQRTHT